MSPTATPRHAPAPTPTDTPRPFAAYVLRTGRYAGHRLCEVAAADPVWLLATFATADTEAVDVVAVRGFVNAHPPLVAGMGWTPAAGAVLTIAPRDPPDEDEAAGESGRWVVRVAGVEVARFAQLASARAYCERIWGVESWARIEDTQILVGEATREAR